jgi:hypothetical protein
VEIAHQERHFVNEKLIAGYRQFASADEFGAASAATPAITPTITITVSVASAVSGWQTNEHGC